MSLSSYFRRHLHSPTSQVARASTRSSQANISAPLYALSTTTRKQETSDIGQLTNRDRYPFEQFLCGTIRPWYLKEHFGSGTYQQVYAGRLRGHSGLTRQDTRPRNRPHLQQPGDYLAHTGFRGLLQSVIESGLGSQLIGTHTRHQFLGSSLVNLNDKTVSCEH